MARIPRNDRERLAETAGAIDRHPDDFKVIVERHRDLDPEFSNGYSAWGLHLAPKQARFHTRSCRHLPSIRTHGSPFRPQLRPVVDFRADSFVSPIPFPGDFDRCPRFPPRPAHYPSI